MVISIANPCQYLYVNLDKMARASLNHDNALFLVLDVGTSYGVQARRNKTDGIVNRGQFLSGPLLVGHRM